MRGNWGTRLRVTRLLIASLAALRHENLCTVPAGLNLEETLTKRGGEEQVRGLEGQEARERLARRKRKSGGLFSRFREDPLQIG